MSQPPQETGEYPQESAAHHPGPDFEAARSGLQGDEHEPAAPVAGIARRDQRPRSTASVGHPSIGGRDHATGAARRFSKRLLVVIIAGVLVLALGIIMVPRLIDRLDTNRWHPTGPEVAWLDEGYAAGFTQFVLPNGVKAVAASADHRIVVGTKPFEDGATGFDVATGEQTWHLDYVSCESIHPSREGFIYCVGYTGGARDVDLLKIDISTGEQESLFSISDAPYVGALTSRGEFKGAEILTWQESNSLVIAAVDGGSATWQISLTTWEGIPACYLLGSHIACDSREAFTVLDASDGHASVNSTPLDESQRVVWASDGYAVEPWPHSYGESNTATLYDFDGAALGQWNNLRISSPSWYDAFFYPLDELQRDQMPLLVDAKGDPVVTDGSEYGKVSFSQSGVEAEAYTITAGSAGGSVVLITTTPTTQTLYSGNGDQLWPIDGNPAFTTTVDGLIVVEGEDLAAPDTILVPVG